MIVRILASCLKSVYHMHAVPAEAKRGSQIPLIQKLTGSPNKLYGCWESNPDPMQDQPVLSYHEPSLHTHSPQLLTSYYVYLYLWIKD